MFGPFRDELINDPALLAEYNALKQRLDGEEYERYTAKKGAFVERVLREISSRQTDATAHPIHSSVPADQPETRDCLLVLLGAAIVLTGCGAARRSEPTEPRLRPPSNSQLEPFPRDVKAGRLNLCDGMYDRRLTRP